MKTAILNLMSKVKLSRGAGLVAASVLTAAASLALATPIEIDTFNAPDPAQYFVSNDRNVPPTAVPTALLKTDDAGIYGGQRDMLLQAHAVPGGPVTTYSFAGEIGGMLSSHGELATASKAGTSLTLQYDGIDPAGSPDTTAGLVDAKNVISPKDLTDGGTNNEFLLGFGYLNTETNAELRLRVTVESGKGEALFQGTIPENDNPFFHVVKFKDFTGYSANPASNPFTDVQSVTFELNYAVDGKADTNVDIELRDIQAVPEPSTVAMGGMGCLVLLGQVVLRKWRKGSEAK